MNFRYHRRIVIKKWRRWAVPILLAALPWANLMHITFHLRLPFHYSRGILSYLAAMTSCRALFGADVWLRLTFYLDWVFARLEADRCVRPPHQRHLPS